MNSDKKFVACIGSRKLALSEESMNQARAIGAYLAATGWIVKTGAAEGADQAFAEGAASIIPGSVRLYLPWADYTAKDGTPRGYNSPWVSAMEKKGVGVYCYNKWEHTVATESVNHFHPAGENLKGAVRSLHARNWLIMHDNYEASNMDCRVTRVVAWPGENLGGTGQGLRIAEDMSPKPEIFRLDNPEVGARVILQVRKFFTELANSQQ